MREKESNRRRSGRWLLQLLYLLKQVDGVKHVGHLEQVLLFPGRYDI